VGGSCQACERFWVIYHDGVSKNQPYREHLVLVRTKGEQDPCTGPPTRTSGEWRLFDTSAKHHRVLHALLLYFLAFTLSFYIPRIAMLE